MIKCEDCFYSIPVEDEEVVLCSYMNDIITLKEGKLDYRAKRTAEDFAELTGFSGDAFVVKIGDKWSIAVKKDSHCSKFSKK